MNVKHLINRAIIEFPKRTALVYDQKRLTFQEIGDRCNRLANGLLSLGLYKGDRIGMLLHNCNEFIEIDFALSKTGLVRVPLNARLREEDHIYMLNDSGANTLIFGESFLETVTIIKSRLKTVKSFVCLCASEKRSTEFEASSYDDLLSNSSSADPRVTIQEKDLHTLFYTSGTTGLPKGVMLTQKSWANVTINLLLDYGPVTSEDVILNLQPLSHGAGFFVLPFFVKGATNLLLPKFDPQLVFETIEKEKVTVLKLVPTMLRQLLDFPEKTQYKLDSLHSIIYGGSPISIPLLTRALKHFGQRLVQLYGQAEAPMCISTLSKKNHIIDGNDEDIKRLGSAGKPCVNVEVKIVDDSGEEVKTESIGEVVVKGYHLMTGYWNLPDETDKAIRDGWVYTGDMGYFDSSGFIYLVDRKKEMIISGGFNIYPKEIENALASHPNVKDVAVFGIPDDKWGEAVKAVVVLDPEAEVTEQELINYCTNRIASFKKPKSIEFIEELPRNPYGKVQKNVLREPYWRGRERKIN